MMIQIAHSLRWMLSLIAKCGRVVPMRTITIVCLTLVSLGSALLASFLPLKVVILLGSEHMPSYLPESWASFGKEGLIVLLCVGALGVYLLHLFSERAIRRITASGAARLLRRSHKMALFENQEELAQEAYLRFSRALASVVFVCFALIGLAAVYPMMAMFLLTYLLLATSVLWLLQCISARFFHALQTRLFSVLTVVAGLGFFSAFAYLVMDFILWTPPSIMVGMIALLVSRQVMQRLAGMIVDVASLQYQQGKLDALFFHARVFVPALPGGKTEFWGLLAPSQRQYWVEELLHAFTPWQHGPLKFSWQQTGVIDVAALLLETDSSRYYVKIYNKNKRSLALHESTLLLDMRKGLPALPLLGATEVAGLQCLLFELDRGEFNPPLAVKALQKPLLMELLKVQPGQALSQRYLRSRASLWQRLSAPLLERMQVAVVVNEQQQCLNLLLNRLPDLNGVLRHMPLWLATPDIVGSNVYGAADGALRLLSWHRWYLEPIAAGWPLTLQEDLPSVLQQAKCVRNDLEFVSVEHLELAAIAAALEAACNAQRYSDALSLLPKLFDRLDTCLGVSSQSLNLA